MSDYTTQKIIMLDGKPWVFVNRELNLESLLAMSNLKKSFEGLKALIDEMRQEQLGVVDTCTEHGEIAYPHLQLPSEEIL